MSNTIDCSNMSHVACEPPDAPVTTPAQNEAPAAAPTPQSEPLVASYDCVNECASSIGAAALVEGAVAGLGCLALPPACPAFITAVPVTILEACNDACLELEKR